LERFTNREITVLVCTDVAARGLDIKDVENVIHYQIPFNVDTFVHRCGRTARIGKPGKTLCLVGPKDMVRYAKLEKDMISNGVNLKDFEVPMRESEKIQ
jgi:superfamily II DNA/RNA helicase